MNFFPSKNSCFCWTLICRSKLIKLGFFELGIQNKDRLVLISYPYSINVLHFSRLYLFFHFYGTQVKLHLAYSMVKLHFCMATGFQTFSLSPVGYSSFKKPWNLKKKFLKINLNNRSLKVARIPICAKNLHW